MENLITMRASREQALAARLGELQARSVKLGLDCGIGFEVVKRWSAPAICPRTGTEQRWQENWMQVRVLGEAPRLRGWTLKARLDFKAIPGSVLVGCVPGFEAPLSLREVPSTRCDHCNASRLRNDLFLVHHEDGREAIVGRSCLRDFLGHHSPEHVAELARLLVTVAACDPEERDWWGGSEPEAWPAAQVLSLSASMVRREGYRNDGGTGGDVFNALCPNKASQAWAAEQFDLIEDCDVETAEQIVEWLTDLEPSGNYEANLKAAIVSGTVTRRSLNIAASAVVAFERSQRRAQATARPASRSTWIGVEGERMDFTGLLLVRRLVTENHWGCSTMLRFVDADENVLVWWASGSKDLTEGSRYDVRGTIKGHDEFRGEKQTKLSRCKVTKV